MANILGDIGKVAGTVANVANPYSLASGLLGAATHQRFGTDLTPSYSLTNTIRTQAGNLTSGGGGSSSPSPAPGGSNLNVTNQPGGTYDQSGGYVLGDSTTAAQQQQAAADNAYIDSQVNDLNGLLGRTDTGLNQGLESLNSSYGNSVAQQNAQKAQALQDYTDKRVATNKDKLGAYDKINQNANAGYRSLAQIIGRGAGTGSSAFQELLPDAIGKEMSGQRTDTNQTYATNLGNIDTAQKKTEQSFAQILQDLANQRAAQEQQLRTGVEQQRQGILGNIQQLQASRGNYGAAQALQPQIDHSRNSVEGFFNQFKPTYSAAPAAIAAPDLSQYNVDRSVVNAQQQGAPDPTNPYADLLRKRLQEQSGGF